MFLTGCDAFGRTPPNSATSSFSLIVRRWRSEQHNDALPAYIDFVVRARGQAFPGGGNRFAPARQLYSSIHIRELVSASQGTSSRSAELWNTTGRSCSYTHVESLRASRGIFRNSCYRCRAAYA